MKKLMLSVFALAAVVFGANAADGTATQEGLSSATLQAPIQIAAATNGGTGIGGGTVLDGANLKFGVINVVSAGGTVAVSQNNGWTATAGMTKTTAVVPSAAAFTIEALEGVAYAVVVTGTTPLTRVSGSEILPIAFDFPATGVVGATAALNTFFVGGTLTIPANSKLGAYAGAFDVTVNYN